MYTNEGGPPFYSFVAHQADWKSFHWALIQSQIQCVCTSGASAINRIHTLYNRTKFLNDIRLPAINYNAHFTTNLIQIENRAAYQNCSNNSLTMKYAFSRAIRNSLLLCFYCLSIFIPLEWFRNVKRKVHLNFEVTYRIHPLLVKSLWAGWTRCLLIWICWICIHTKQSNVPIVFIHS